MMTKEEKNSLFYEHRGYIKLIVQQFLMRYKTYLYMYDDMVGEANMRFLVICDKFDPNRDTKFTTFLNGQLRFYLMNMLKKEVVNQVSEETFVEINEWEEAYDPYAFEELLRQAPLSPNQKEIFRLRYIVELTLQEIADEMGCSKQAIDQACQRGLKTLRKSL